MSETGRLLADTAARMIEQSASPEALLANIVEGGLHMALVPEAAGGGGCTLEDVSWIAETWGARAAPLPIVEMLLAPWLAARVGHEDEAAAGNRTITALALTAVAAALPARALLQSDLEAPGLPGCAAILMPERRSPDEVVVTLHAVSAAGRFRDLTGQDWLRLPIGQGRDSGVELGRIGAEDSLFLATSGAALTVSALVGAMDSVLRLMIDYANTRSQFGRPIGKFQAVQHLIAEAAGELEVTRAARDALLLPMDGEAGALFGHLSAKAQAGRAATFVASAAHQVFGAIGYSEEHELHHLTKRLWMWRDDWGRQSDCEEAIGRIAIDAGRANLWPLIVATGQFQE